MCFFKRKVRIGASGILNGFTDWHCHILPGVDDGFKEIADSLSVLEEYENAGVSELWLTPHIMEDIPNEVSALKARFAEFTAAYEADCTRRGVSRPLKLHLASENMLDALFEKRLESGDLLPLGERKLLVETSYFNPPIDLYGIMRRIKSAGYFPVLAHPERYIYMKENDYKSLKEMGVLFQLNLPSLVGLYGPEAQSKANMLLGKGYYNMYGTDLHRKSVFGRLLEGKVGKKIIEKVAE